MVNTQTNNLALQLSPGKDNNYESKKDYSSTNCKVNVVSLPEFMKKYCLIRIQDHKIRDKINNLDNITNNVVVMPFTQYDSENESRGYANLAVILNEKNNPTYLFRSRLSKGGITYTIKKLPENMTKLDTNEKNPYTNNLYKIINHEINRQKKYNL